MIKYTVDIIIPTYLKTDWLIQRTAECFQSIIDTTKDFRIIWVDNGSNQNARNQVLSAILPIKDNVIQPSYHRYPLGFVKATNIGIDIALREQAKYIVFLNNDTITTPNWLDNMIKYGCDITGPWPCPERIRKDAIDRGYDIKRWKYSEKKEKLFAYAKKAQVLSKLVTKGVDFIPFYCVLFKRYVIEKLGHLNVEFGDGLFDDDDYLWKARKRKFKLGIATDSYVHHFAKQTFVSKPEEEDDYRKLYMENWEKFKQLHPSWRTMRRYINCENQIQTWLKANSST